ncbi:MAG: phospho-N-acetylmuramoyl-pentapeptide-transferase, partial [Pseudomonadota bacterium]
MLYELLAAESGPLNVLNYITFRTGAAIVTAFLIATIAGRPMIDWLRARQGKGQPIRDLSFEDQMSKRGTPTMGGFIIWVGLFSGTLLWADLKNPYIWAVLFITVIFGALGFLDDYAKVTKQTEDGVSARMRLLTEFIAAGIVCAFIMGLHGAHTPMGHADWGSLNGLAQFIADLAPKTSVEPNSADFSGGVAVPFLNDYFVPLGGFFVLFGMIVIVGSANAVNFTDGLDGLAIVPMMFACLAFAVIAY